MASQNTMKRVIAQLEKLKKENQEYKQIAKNQINFNRKLCSENRKRRLTNNQLKKQEQDRIFQLEIARGNTLQLKKLIKNLQISFEEKEKHNMDLQDEVLVLRTDITKLNQRLQQLTDNSKVLQKKYKDKCQEYDILYKNSYRQAQTSKLTPKGVYFDEQLMSLINQNCELQKKIKDFKDIINAYHQKIARMELQIKEMCQQIESKNEIISIIVAQNERQKHEPGNVLSNQKSSQESTPLEILINQIQLTKTQSEEKVREIQKDKKKPKQNQDWQQHLDILVCQKLKIRVQQFCKDYQHLLYSNKNIQNLNEDPVTLNYCQVIQTNLEGVWTSRIKIASEGELYFGVADARFNYIEVMKPVRNFVYYNNCTGGVVINKDGRLIEEFARKGDTLQLTISLKNNRKEIVLNKNNKQIYTLPYPECFKKSQKLFLFIKLFRFMSVDLY